MQGKVAIVTGGGQGLGEAAVRAFVEQTRQHGYSVRAPDFGGDYSRPRDQVDDRRNSIAMPKSGSHSRRSSMKR